MPTAGTNPVRGSAAPLTTAERNAQEAVREQGLCGAIGNGRVCIRDPHRGPHGFETMPEPDTAAHWSEGHENRNCAPLAVITEVTIFGGDPDSEDPYAIEVTWRGHDKYAVKRRSQVWNGSEWEWEPQPSSRDDAFIARTRFAYEQAMNLAVGLVAKEVARA